MKVMQLIHSYGVTTFTSSINVLQGLKIIFLLFFHQTVVRFSLAKLNHDSRRTVLTLVKTLVKLLLYHILGLLEETATSLKPTTNETATNSTNPDT